MTTSDKETGEITGLALLRLPFSANQISKLPKPYKKESPKGKCAECGGYHGLPAMHLDYVGHAALTDRLLDADPTWTWEPVATDENGQPKLDENGGMWIKLTVCGVTRLGYGDAQGKDGANAVKERIGDALRNAAMRFGAALDLWHKGDLHAEDEPPATKQILSGPIPANYGAKDNVSPEEAARVKDVAMQCLHWLKQDPPNVADAVAVADEAEMVAEEVLFFWTFFSSSQRAAMKAEQKALRERSLKREAASQA